MIRSIRINPPISLIQFTCFTLLMIPIAMVLCYMGMDSVVRESYAIDPVCLNGNTMHRYTPECNRAALRIIKSANKAEREFNKTNKGEY